LLFKPPIEELRDKYYQEIRNFISFPVTSFQGVGGSTEVYKMMPEKNAAYLNVVYERAEGLFEKLEALLSKFGQWAVVGTLDPETIQLPTLEEWESFMKEVRVRRKDLEKIHDVHRVECFTVNLGVFKQQVDETLTKLIDGMMAELKN
jgi:dynein heavy chain 2